MSDYYILERSGGDMLLYSLPNPSRREHWLFGKRFTTPLKTPVVVSIQDGYEKTKPSPFFSTPPVMHNDVYEVLLAAGVNNLNVYDAVLRDSSGSVEYGNYKAYNIIGSLNILDLSKSTFATDNSARLFDASIESMMLDPNKKTDLLMFRATEYVGAIIIHRRVKEALESARFPHLKFTQPADFIS